jgi:hypothetical protein
MIVDGLTTVSCPSAPAPMRSSAHEVLVLRHQLRVLEHRVASPWQPGDRFLLAAFSRLLPRSGRSALLPRPETLLRWHRDLLAFEAMRQERREPFDWQFTSTDFDEHIAEVIQVSQTAAWPLTN